MSSGENGVKLPPQEIIDGWNSLSINPLPESSACAVPKTVFVEYHNEGFYNRSLFEKEHPMLTANSNVSQIKLFADSISRADELITKVYTRRCVSHAIKKFVSETKNVLIQEAKPNYDEIFNLCQSIMLFVKDAVNTIHRLFELTTIWQNGHYSDTLIDVTCQLFYKISTIDEMKLIKSALINDLTIFKNMALGNQYNSPEIAELRTWLPQKNFVDSALIEAEKSRGKNEKQALSQIFVSYITHKLEKQEYLQPEMVYVYVRFLMFLGRYTEQDAKTITFLAHQAAKHQLLPLAFEVSIHVPDYCKSIAGFDKEYKKEMNNAISMQERLRKLKVELETSISEFPGQVAAADHGKLSPEKFYETVINIIRDIASVKNALREQHANKLANPPAATTEDEKKQYMYERSVRRGYSHDELKTLLQLLMLWRSLSDQLRDNSEIIIRIISELIAQHFQEFVKNTCQTIIRKSKSNFEQRIREIIETMASFVGDWQQNEQMFPVTRKKPPPHSIVERKAAPNLAAIEFARVQIQHIMNPNSEFMKGGVKKLFKKEKIANTVNKFLADSTFWTTILQFGQLLSNISDQSDLFFKEVQLDLNKTINFPIRSSLPFVLSEFALHNFMIPELTELIFYPLGIYDDASRIAQQKLQSRFLLDEIRAEADMCIRTLSLMLSDFTYESFYTFTALKTLPSTFPNAQQRAEIKSWPESRAYRLSTLLQQNQFYLDYTQIDLKSLLSAPIESQILDAMVALIRLANNHGIASLVAVNQGFDIIRETHRLLCEQGIELPRFDTLLKACLGDTVANSFVSVFCKSMLGSASKKVSHHYYLRTNPLRLSIIKPRSIPQYAFGKGAIGKALKIAFEPTVNPITVDHFVGLQRLFDDGTMSYFVRQLNNEVDDAVQRLISQYDDLMEASLVQRISDLSISTSAQLVFDRYEGAYSSFADDPIFKKLISEMRTVGNLLAMGNMIDIAISNSRLTRAQILAFLKGHGLDGKEYNQCELLYPQPLAQALKEDTGSIPDGSDVYPLVLTMFLATIKKNIDNNIDLFAERSNTILDFTTLTGFASIWSVLEFVFIYSEAFRNEQMESPLETYGEGVMLTAAAILLITKQERIRLATNIGRRIQRVREVDFSANKDLKLIRFCGVNQYETASLEWAMSVFHPIIKHINNTGGIE